MTHLGLGATIGLLGGNEDTVKAIQGALGKEIAEIELRKGEDYEDYYDALCLTFVDETKIIIFDDGQSCGEERYMTTDDDLQYFVGATFLDTEIAEAPDVEGDSEVHEVQFLNIKTSKGVFTMETHNRHNGWYGGFLIRAKEIK